MINSNNIIEKLKEHLSIYTDESLSKYLGIHQSTLSGWRKRNTINIELIIEKVNNIDMNWLLYDQELENTDEHSSKKPKKYEVNEMQVEYSSDDRILSKGYTKIPVYHGVSAGSPTQHFDSPKEFIRLDHIVNKNYVGISVNTDEYKGYGFDKGDILLVDTMRTPMNENLVLIEINNSYGMYVYLDIESEIKVKGFNNKEATLFNENMTIVGVVVSKMKKLL
jgi:SOS-response transcriptional repressor LexA